MSSNANRSPVPSRAAGEATKSPVLRKPERRARPLTDDAESAILTTLIPDAYTAIVRGKNDTTGVALVEAYQLDD